jgi:hypothetical protein
VTFKIDRQGGAVSGSTRAERQQSVIDLDKRTAKSEFVGLRQLEPRAPTFRPEPVVSQFLGVVVDFTSD